MSDHRDGDTCPNTSASACRPSFALGRSFPGRSNPNPPPPGRLSSLRSRDLTLGGFKKKTFVPNVHSVRKTKDELREDPDTAPKKEKREKEERPREYRGRRRERPQTIQSHSIFEQGPADTVRKIGSWDRAEHKESGLSPVLKCVKKEKNLNEEDESEILQKLHRDDFLDDPGLKNDVRNRPIQLPLHKSSGFFNTVKEETRSDCTSSKVSSVGAQRLAATAKAPSSPQQPNVAELFQQLSVSDEEALLFIHLPDSMPGKPTARSNTPPKKDVKPEDATRLQRVKAPEPIGKESTPVLSDFSEGFIGKLQIRKSGRVQLILGEVALDISEGAAFSFLQELVSVRLSDGLTGDLSVLGTVKHKLVCSPDFESLLQEVEHSSNT